MKVRQFRFQILAKCLISFWLFASNLAADDVNRMKVLFDFTDTVAAEPWRSVNDGVMGGLSSGAARIDGGGMRFEGNLSLENNGGFSSVRMATQLDLSEWSGIKLKVRGDGRRYDLRLQSDARFRGRGAVSFGADLQTVDGEWIEIEIPFDELRQSWRGMQLTGYTFNPKTIQEFGLLIGDKTPGPFQIDVAWIGAYR